MEDVRLLLGDALGMFACFEAAGVGAVVTDPPYGIRHVSSHGASWEGRPIAGDSDTAARDAVLAWAEGRGLPWAAFGVWKRPAPAGTRGVLVWDKGPAFGCGDLGFPWKPSWESIFIGGRGWKGRRDEGVLRGHQVVSWETKGRCHPHQKPVSLLECLLRKLPEGVLVLDPFMGSGSVGVACARTGYSFIGVEVDPHWHAVAVRRVEEARSEGPLFARQQTLFAGGTP